MRLSYWDRRRYSGHLHSNHAVLHWMHQVTLIHDVIRAQILILYARGRGEHRAQQSEALWPEPVFLHACRHTNEVLEHPPIGLCVERELNLEVLHTKQWNWFEGAQPWGYDNKRLRRPVYVHAIKADLRALLNTRFLQVFPGGGRVVNSGWQQDLVSGSSPYQPCHIAFVLSVHSKCQTSSWEQSVVSDKPTAALSANHYELRW
jgi:hypothetical protein